MRQVKWPSAGVTLAHEAERFLELRPFYITARDLVGKDPIECHAVELALEVLIQDADAGAADALTLHVILPGHGCQDGVYKARRRKSGNNLDANPTPSVGTI